MLNFSLEIFEWENAQQPTSASSRRPLGPPLTQVTHHSLGLSGPAQVWPGLPTPGISCSLRGGFRRRAQPAPSGASPNLQLTPAPQVMESFSASSAIIHKSKQTTTNTMWHIDLNSPLNVCNISFSWIHGIRVRVVGKS